jgi:hypothetical protein
MQNSLVSRESLNHLHELEKTQDRYAAIFFLPRFHPMIYLRSIQNLILTVRSFANFIFQSLNASEHQWHPRIPRQAPEFTMLPGNTWEIPTYKMTSSKSLTDR